MTKTATKTKWAEQPYSHLRSEEDIKRLWTLTKRVLKKLITSGKIWIGTSYEFTEKELRDHHDELDK